jgi:hypothetical protein
VPGERLVGTEFCGLAVTHRARSFFLFPPQPVCAVRQHPGRAVRDLPVDARGIHRVRARRHHSLAARHGAVFWRPLSCVERVVPPPDRVVRGVRRLASRRSPRRQGELPSARCSCSASKSLLTRLKRTVRHHAVDGTLLDELQKRLDAAIVDGEAKSVLPCAACTTGVALQRRLAGLPQFSTPTLILELVIQQRKNL